MLAHDHHDDNLDPAGRALLPSAGVVVTTVSGAKRRCRARARALGNHTARGTRADADGDAVELCRLMRPRNAIPIHDEGWKHFRQGRDAIEREFARAPEDIRRRIRQLPIGVQVKIAA